MLYSMGHNASIENLSRAVRNLLDDCFYEMSIEDQSSALMAVLTSLYREVHLDDTNGERHQAAKYAMTLWLETMRDRHWAELSAQAKQMSLFGA